MRDQIEALERKEDELMDEMRDLQGELSDATVMSDPEITKIKKRIQVLEFRLGDVYDKLEAAKEEEANE